MSSEETNPRIVVLQNNFKVCGKKKTRKKGKNQEKPGKTRKNQEKENKKKVLSWPGLVLKKSF
jgi:hypothetical protein